MIYSIMDRMTRATSIQKRRKERKSEFLETLTFCVFRFQSPQLHILGIGEWGYGSSLFEKCLHQSVSSKGSGCWLIDALDVLHLQINKIKEMEYCVGWWELYNSD